ncbi:MAG: glycoside hydrolase family 9 protein [Clostridium sp.]|nr:glycoside hydrolase family 9 protein [Clostridium sp.]MCM1548100.1 glycoside hydrolase family 9 protein [Ruminococcus sp.]
MRLKKIAAAITSLTMLFSAAAVPTFNISVSAAETVISSTFASSASDWGIYKEKGGAGTLKVDNGRLALNITSLGTVNYGVQMYYDIVPLYKNGEYHLSYEISSDTDRYVEAMIQQNGGTYQAYTWKGLDLTSEPLKVDYTFTMTKDTDIMSKFVFNCGLPNEGNVPSGAHTIYLDNVLLELVDDSKVDYSEIRAYEPPIVTNQLGYKPDDRKIAVIRRNNDSEQVIANEFSVVNAETNKTVYTGELSAEQKNFSAGESDWLADFSSVTAIGKYYIKSSGLDDSYTFEISDDPYGNLLDDTVRMLYLQRCGTAIEDNDFSHAACHTGKARVYGTSQTIDVSGGWHDAGDYGRYVVPAAKTVADLLNAYGMNPYAFTDSVGIPESGNGIPDVLDEVEYALEWMLKMQEPSTGGVHHKVTCESFPGYVMPEKETDELIATPVSTTATADFCGAMAMAYEYYYDIDRAFANTCLSAAEKAWSFLEENPNLIFKNPEDVTTGDYGDSSDKDERYWAAAQLYRATSENKYLTALEDMTARTGMDWSTMGDYGNIAIVTMENIDKSLSVYNTAKSKITSQASTLAKRVDSSPYGSPVTSYNWGSNMTIANAGVILAISADIMENEDYEIYAKEIINYLLGRNPNGECFVTGYGTVSPQQPHHRPSMAKNKPMKGMLVGGVNSEKEDSAAKAYLSGVSPAKCYVDHWESYSTNEITTYWNSPLIYLLALTDQKIPESDIKGDVKPDNKVNTADVSLLQKYIVKKVKFTSNQYENADMNSDGAVNVIDVTLLRRSIVKGNTGGFENPVVTTVTDAPKPSETTTSYKTSDETAEPDTEADMTADFRNGASSYFEASDGWTNGDPFDCGWYSENAVIKNAALNLTIDTDKNGKYNYSAAEYRTKDFYGYGYYETSMQAIKNDGVVSSFFTYTGPSDNNPWDEIDIEVLGKDTTKVQFNYYTNGVGNHEYMYDLGFDASAGFHTYGFLWKSDSITWFIDGEAVYTAYEDIPSVPGKIMMNVWPGTGVDEWLKPFNGNTPLTAKYQWVTYKSLYS